MLGLDRPLATFTRDSLVQAISPWSLAVGVFTVVTIVAARRFGFRAIALFAGLLGGTLAHYAFLATRDVEQLGGTIGALPSLVDIPSMWGSLFEIAPAAIPASALLTVGSTAVGIAVVGSVLTLLAARSIEDLVATRTDSNRELLGQGLGNLLGAFLGGQPVAGSPTASIAAYGAGGRTRLATVCTALLLVLGVVLAAPWIASFPFAALAGVMFVIAFDLVDREPLKILGDLRRGAAHRQEGLIDLAIIAAVAIASVTINIVSGVLVGVIVAITVFAIKSSHNVVRRFSTGTVRRSFRQRGQRETEILAASGASITLFELEGPIFFGTAEKLADEIETHAPKARFVILDFTRVNGVDATGAHVIDQLARRLAQAGGRIVIASLSEHDRRRRSLERGLRRAHAEWQPDADRALEWCEERLLAEHGRDSASLSELGLDHIDLCSDLDPAEVAVVRGAVTREEHAPGTVLFRGGDAGNAVYLLAKGAVSILLESSQNVDVAKRIVTFAPGVSFGEQAILDGRPRSATAVCDQEVVVFVLSTATLELWRTEHPQLAIKLYRTMAQGLATRLRNTTTELHHVAGG
jgi:SulP family sulfate permease